MEKRTVPSFASFKPRSSAAVPADHKEHPAQDRDRPFTRHSEDQNAPSERKHRPHQHSHPGHELHRDSGRKHDRHRRDHEHRPRYERHTELRQQAATPPLVQESSDDCNLFMIDRRGDAKNVEYGGLHRYSVPAYHRIGYGRVLGAAKYAKIDRHTSNEKGILLRIDHGRGGERRDGLLTKKNAKPEDMEAMDLELDFIAFRSTLKRKRGSESPEDGLPDVDYRSVEGKAKVELNPQDEDLEFASSSDETGDAITLDTHARAQNAELSRAAKTDPTNADAWLALIEHQAYHTFPGVDLGDFTSSQRRTVSDIRLSILDQAFKNISSGTPGHDRLVLAQINEGSKIWETSKLSKKWQNALAQKPQSMFIWREYLNYLQASPAIFRYEQCRDAYLKCLETLANGLAKAEPSTRTTLVDNIIYILLRYTIFARDAGYDELAIAMWQALLEYYLFAPHGLQGQPKLNAFESFWDTDAPRIGEKGSDGWRAFTSELDSNSMSRNVDLYNLPSLDTSKPLTSFAIAEKSIASAFFLPAAAGDEEDESEDPFRYVMFSDIRPVLERLPDTLDSKLVVDAFLYFMGLSPVDQRNGFSQEWHSDPYLQSAYMTDGTVQSLSRRYDSFSLFRDAFRGYHSNEANDFVAQALSALIQASPDYEKLGEYHLAFLSRTNPVEATKTAKRLLKGRPASLRYYNAYALKEASIAGASDLPDKAKQIWTKALDLSRSLAEAAREETILLWHSWLMSCINYDDINAALRILLAMPDGSAAAVKGAPANVSAGAVLRAKSHPEERIDHMHLKGNYEQAALHASCLAWLNYLSTGHDVNAALQSFTTSSARFQKASSAYALELLHQAKARLLGCHMAAKKPFKPTQFRDELAESRRRFPENGAILKQYYEVANRTRLDDRLRSALSEANSRASPSCQGVTSCLFAIDAEINRCSIDGGSATRDSVRALFRRALLSPDSTNQASLLLWKRWFDFERSAFQHLSDREDPQRKDAVRRTKQVFLDGLRFLPWNKRWAVEGMAAFAQSGDMGEEELRQIHDMLMDRELRVRVDVDALTDHKA